MDSLDRNGRVEQDVSLLRIYILRGAYLLLIVGLGLMNLPVLLHHEPAARGVIPSFLGAIWLLAFLGLRYPVQMLPLLLFELAWKAIWLFTFGWPQKVSGNMPPTWKEDFQAIAPGVVLMLLVIPWGHFYRRYLKQPSERWK